MKNISQIIQNIGVLLVGRFLAFLVGFAVNLVLARTFDRGVFGEFHYLIIYLTYFMSIIDFGINSLAVRAIVERKKDAGKILGSLVTLKLIFSPVVFGLCLLVSILLGHGESTQLHKLIWIGAFSIFFFPWNTLEVAFQVEHRNWFSVAASFISNTLYLVGVIFCIHMGWELWTLAIVVAAHHALRAVALWALYRIKMKGENWRLVSGLKWSGLKTFLSEASILGVAAFVGVAYFNFDVPVLEKLKGVESVGIYGAAHKIFNFILLVPAVVMIPLYPLLAETFRSDRDKFIRLVQNSFYYLMLLAVPLAIGITFFADEIIILLFTEKFAASARVLIILGWAAPAVFGGGLLSFVLISAKKTHLWLITALGALVVSAVSNLCLVPYLDYEGSAFAKLITEGFVFFAGLIAFSMVLRRGAFKPRIFLRVALIGAIVCAMAYSLRHTDLWVALPVLTATYLTATWRFSGIRFREMLYR